MPRPTSAPPNPPYVGNAAQRTSRDISAVEVGEAVIEIDKEGPGCVAMTVSIGQNAFFGVFDAPAVTQWCAETSVMMAAALEVAAGDELTVRSPMLVAQHQGCVAMRRRIASGGKSSELSLQFASTPDELVQGASLDSGPASAEQANAFLAALQRTAAAAATQSGATE